MQVLDRVGSPCVLAACRGHPVAAAQLVEVQFGGVAVLGLWLERVVAQFVIGLHDAEQVLRGCIQVGDDHAALAELHRRALVEAGRGVGADALLPPFKHYHANPAALGDLLVDPGVQEALGVVPLKRQNLAVLVADLQVARAIELVINHESRKDLISFRHSRPRT